MGPTKEEKGRYLAQCRICGQWHEVRPQPDRADNYFAYWQAEFCCCGTSQTARFTLEKNEIDFH